MVCGDIPSGMDGAGGAGGMGACIGKNLDLGEDRAGAEVDDAHNVEGR